MIPQDFIDGLIRDADLAAIIGRHVTLTKKGGSYLGLCPFHGEKTPSFNVVPDKGFFHCFGCKKSGNVLGFLMDHVHGGDFIAAVNDLAQQLGREVPRTSNASGSNNDRRLAVQELRERVRDRAHEVLMDSDNKEGARARVYLRKHVGLVKETVEKYRLGYLPPDGGLGFLKGKVERGLLLDAGLLHKGDQGFTPYFRDRVMFPIHSARGMIAGFSGLLLAHARSEFLVSPSNDHFRRDNFVPGLHEAVAGIKQHGHALVVEGFLDAVILAQHGVDNAVATYHDVVGRIHLNTLTSRTDQVVFCFDGGGMTRKSVDRLLANVMHLLRDGKDFRFAFLPLGTGPADHVRQHQVAGFQEFLRQAFGLADMLQRTATGVPIAELPDTAWRRKEWQRAARFVRMIKGDNAPFLKAELSRVLSDASGMTVNDLMRG